MADDIDFTAPTKNELRVDYHTLDELGRRRKDGSLLRMKAQMILEEFGLPDSVVALRSDKVPQVDKERVKQNLMKIAGLDNPLLGGGGSGFSITINVGGKSAVAPLNVTPGQIVDQAPAPVRMTFKQDRRFSSSVNSDLSAGLEDY